MRRLLVAAGHHPRLSAATLALTPVRRIVLPHERIDSRLRSSAQIWSNGRLTAIGEPEHVVAYRTNVHGSLNLIATEGHIKLYRPRIFNAGRNPVGCVLPRLGSHIQKRRVGLSWQESHLEKETHMNRPKRFLTATIITAVLSVSACSSTTTPTTRADSDAPTVPDMTAPEPTSAPNTTAAPEPTSAPPAESGSESTTTTNSGAIWAIVLLGVLPLGVVVWLASLSGAKRGAAQQTQEREAAAYEAEHPPTAENGTEEPPDTLK